MRNTRPPGALLLAPLLAALLAALLVHPPSRANDQDPALALVKERQVVEMLRTQAAFSVLKFEEYKVLLCAIGKGRYIEFMSPAFGVAIAARRDEFDRMLAAQLKTRLQDFEIQSVLDKKGRSPFARSYNNALSDSLKAAGPQTVRMGAEVAQAALTAALARATEEGLVTPGAACKE